MTIRGGLPAPKGSGPIVLLLAALFFVALARFPLHSQKRPETAKRPAARQQPLPFDPLTAEEKAAAERIALADARVRELLGTGRRRLVEIELLVTKPESEAPVTSAAPLGRNAAVVFFRFDGEFGVRAVVNISSQKVTDVSRLESAQVPLTADDLNEAFQLAVRNTEVTRTLGAAATHFQIETPTKTAAVTGERNIVRGLRVQATEESDPCWKHRCLQLLFRRGDFYLTEPTVIVDLTAQKVYLERRQP